MEIVVDERYAGPPGMGHGGYVAGLFAARTKGPVQVTLRRPTPLGTPLEMVDVGEGRLELRLGADVLAESEPSMVEVVAPPAPSIEAARAAEPGSPSYWGDAGVHPICFGCGMRRPGGDGLRIPAGPLEVDGVDEVAAVWRPAPELSGPDGSVEPLWVLAALDCAGSFAFLARATPAGLLGRIAFELLNPVPAEQDHAVVGWQIGREGRKLFAGTALFDADGACLAVARATWFAPPTA